jgi:uncharacterized membrane protein
MKIKIFLKIISLFLFLFIGFLIFENLKPINNQTIIKKVLFEDNKKIIFEANLNEKEIKVEYQKRNNIFIPKVGDRVVVEKNEDNYFIADFYRLDKLLILVLIFFLIIFFVIGKESIGSIISLILSFVIIFGSILNNLINQTDPIITVLLSMIFLIPISFYISHGISKKTTIAIIGSLFSIIIALILSLIFIKKSFITGTTAEETSFLATITQKNFDFQGLLIASIIIGIFGSIDDIAISQVSVVEKIISANPKMPAKEIYQKAIAVGKDHVNSIINTLVLVYTSASLPLILLFSVSNKNFFEVLNYEIISVEIIRILIATICVIIAIPLTTYLAVKNLNKRNISNQL